MRSYIKAEKAYRKLALKKEVQIVKLLKETGAPKATLQREKRLLHTLEVIYRECGS